MKSGSRTLPSEIKAKIQAGDCTIDSKGYLRYREKLWVLGVPATTEAEYINTESDKRRNDTLRTKLIQAAHDSPIYGHPGRDAIATILARDFYWPL